MTWHGICGAEWVVHDGVVWKGVVEDGGGVCVYMWNVQCGMGELMCGVGCVVWAVWCWCVL